MMDKDRTLNTLMMSEDALVRALVAHFENRNSFVNNIDALEEVTPAQWNAQLKKAAHELASRIEGTIDDVEFDLHHGEYVEAAPTPTRIPATGLWTNLAAHAQTADPLPEPPKAITPFTKSGKVRAAPRGFNLYFVLKYLKDHGPSRPAAVRHALFQNRKGVGPMGGWFCQYFNDGLFVGVGAPATLGYYVRVSTDPKDPMHNTWILTEAGRKRLDDLEKKLLQNIPSAE